MVGDTVQVEPVHAPPPVQTYEVAAGLQDAVSTDVAPETIDAGDALKLQLGAVVLVVPSESKEP